MRVLREKRFFCFFVFCRGIVTLNVEWLLSQQNNHGMDGNGLLKTYALSMEDKRWLNHLGTLGIMGERATLI